MILIFHILNIYFKYTCTLILNNRCICKILLHYHIANHSLLTNFMMNTDIIFISKICVELCISIVQKSIICVLYCGYVVSSIIFVFIIVLFPMYIIIIYIIIYVIDAIAIYKYVLLYMIVIGAIKQV